MDWKEVEWKGMDWYRARGYRISIPVVDQKGYDFIAEKEGEMVRVNVKLAYQIKNGRGYRAGYEICSAGNAATGRLNNHRNLCDIYLAYIPNKGFVPLKGDFFHTCNRSRHKAVTKEVIAEWLGGKE